MARINTNVASLTAQVGLSKSQKALNTTLTRLSTGLRINSGADDPAGLIASEGLRSEISGINQAIDNSSRATNVIATAEGALSEVGSLLLNIKDLIVQAANSGALSHEEIQANQLQVDSAVQSITRISNTTTFAGLKLLNGSLDYLTSGVDGSVLKGLSIKAASFGTAANIPVNINVVTSARPAALQFRASALAGDVTLEVAGQDGVTTLNFVSGTTAASIMSAVNRVSDTTGIAASLITSGAPASGITFTSSAFGSRGFVSVRAQTGTFNTVTTAGTAANRTTGRDAVATVNGAVTTGDGRSIRVNTVGLDMDLTLADTFGTGTTSFTVTGGGAMFQLGAQVTSNQQVSIGIGSVAASKLGDDVVGFLNTITTDGDNSLVSGNAAAAGRIVEKAIRQVAVLRGRLGAFEKNTLETNINSLQVALENVTSAESSIRDADFAAETSAMTRAQILTQAGTSVLATANSLPQSVLSLLQQ